MKFSVSDCESAIIKKRVFADEKHFLRIVKRQTLRCKFHSTLLRVFHYLTEAEIRYLEAANEVSFTD